MIVLWPHYFDRELSLTREEKRQVNKRAWKIWFQRRSNVAVYVAVLVPLNPWRRNSSIARSRSSSRSYSLGLLINFSGFVLDA